MQDTKPATQSLTIQSIAVTLLVIIYQLVGVTQFGLPEIPEAVFGVLTSLGLLVAGYGRYRAKTEIK